MLLLIISKLMINILEHVAGSFQIKTNILKDKYLLRLLKVDSGGSCDHLNISIKLLYNFMYNNFLFVPNTADERNLIDISSRKCKYLILV